MKGVFSLPIYNFLFVSIFILHGLLPAELEAVAEGAKGAGEVAQVAEGVDLLQGIQKCSQDVQRLW